MKKKNSANFVLAKMSTLQQRMIKEKEDNSTCVSIYCIICFNLLFLHLAVILFLCAHLYISASDSRLVHYFTPTGLYVHQQVCITDEHFPIHCKKMLTVAILSDHLISVPFLLLHRKHIAWQLFASMLFAFPNIPTPWDALESQFIQYRQIVYVKQNVSLVTFLSISRLIPGILKAVLHGWS